MRPGKPTHMVGSAFGEPEEEACQVCEGDGVLESGKKDWDLSVTLAEGDEENPPIFTSRQGK